MNESLIILERVNTWFPNHKSILGKPRSWIKAVSDVSLDIIEGECLGLVGESGCGKSTLGRAILRLAPLISGKIRFMGDDISTLDSKALKPYRANMQMVFQDPKASLNPKMTIFKILREALVLNSRVTKENYLEQAVELLDIVDLRPDHIYRYPHEFSGGQQQRICIARALATDPRFIVFDEATSALDVSVQAQIINLMRNLQDRLNLTYLFISHDLSIMEHVCARVAVMYAGQIVEVQEAGLLFDVPRHPYTKALKNAVPTADPESRKELGILKGEVPKLSDPPSGCRFHPRCDYKEDICIRKNPLKSQTGENSWVRCHFHEKLWQQGDLINSKESL
ncbi:MAG: peptide ABC transporter ATP-binding protein [Deltaproteobacteria bacterium]|nr:MAG: peptide ABC transporter ATP-binding protein [Deltaproteobacteria bacterium]